MLHWQPLSLTQSYQEAIFDKGPNTEPCGIPSSFNSLAAQIQPTIKQVMGR